MKSWKTKGLFYPHVDTWTKGYIYIKSDHTYKRDTHMHNQDLLPDQLILGTFERASSDGGSWSAQTRPKTRLSSRIFILLALIILLLEKLRVSQLLERMWVCATFYSIRLLVQHMMNQQLFIIRPWLHINHLTISWLAVELFWRSVVFIKRLVLREA